ncbi:MAG: type II secretion system F family protein [Candidatus Aenigmatarchaeota archaeon]|nr:type II secretion system F family protein [Candidatus Aenigmarchaeota archaeon]
MNKLYIITSIIGCIIFSINVIYFLNYQKIFTIINIIAILILFGIPIFSKYYSFLKVKNIEKYFPLWLGDVSRNIRSGMTLSQAIVKTKENRYGNFSKILKHAAIQIDWGVSFSKILEEIKIKCKSEVISQALLTIEEAYKSGGKIAETLERVEKNINEINKLKEERYSTIYSQVITGYIIFIIFLVVIYIMKTQLLPMLSNLSSETNISNYIIHLTIIQAVFSGIIIGKLSEGKIISGLKHSLILFIMSYGIFGLL